jgi:hypothetical protein
MAINRNSSNRFVATQTVSATAGSITCEWVRLAELSDKSYGEYGLSSENL